MERPLFVLLVAGAVAVFGLSSVYLQAGAYLWALAAFVAGVVTLCVAGRFA